MDGILNVLKPAGMSSHDVVVYIRRLLGVRKAGHTGTLDFGACGVLAICMGKATRIAEFLVEGEKEYRAEMVLGVATDTDDAFGSVTGRLPASHISPARIREVFREFTGTIQQVPPAVSAIKRGGVRAYKLARRGQAVELEPRRVRIHSLTLLRYKGGVHPRALFNVVCSRGTYIRSLCRDIGKRLGTGGHMGYLIRTRTADFKLGDALTLEEVAVLKARGELEGAVVSMSRALGGFPVARCTPEAGRRIRNGIHPIIGKEIRVPPGARPGGMLRLEDEGGRLLALGRCQPDGYIRLYKVFG